MTLRVHEPGVPVAQLTTGAAATEARPRASVRAEELVGEPLLDAGPCFWRTACTRLMRRGKSSSHSCGGTYYNTNRTK